MGARYFSTPILGCLTADVRSQGSELNSEMLAAGCTQTADTGQIDWLTVTATTANQVLGYETWSIMAGALKMKITYQTSTTLATDKCLRLTVVIGTGTDGAGNITGVLFSMPITTANNLVSAGNKPSFISEASDFFALIWKVGGPTSGGGYTPSLLGFTVEKIAGADGLPDGSGYKLLVSNIATSGASGGNTAAVAYVDVGGGVYTANGSFFCQVPFNTTNSNVGTDRQVFLHQFPTPRVKFGLGVCTVIEAEFPINTTFAATLVGATPRNYISVGFGLGLTNAAGGTVRTWSCAIIWEP